MKLFIMSLRVFFVKQSIKALNGADCRALRFLRNNSVAIGFSLRFLKNRRLKSAAAGFFILFLVLPLSSVYAADQIDFISILKNLKFSSDSVFKLTTAISYGLGFWFMIAALMDLKQHGQSGGGQGASMTGPLIKFFVGVALIYLPSTVSSIAATFWGEGGSIIAYSEKGGSVLETFKTTAITIVRLVGLISFISGFMELAHSSDQGAQPGVVAKGVFRVFSGILAINVVASIKILEATFGITIL